LITAAARPSPAHSRIFRTVVRCSPCPAAVSSERLAYVALMKRAAATFLPEQVCGLEVAEMTAVVPTSQITLDVMAAHLVLGNRAAPIPQSVYGLGPEPGSLLELSATALPAITRPRPTETPRKVRKPRLALTNRPTMPPRCAAGALSCTMVCAMALKLSSKKPAASRSESVSG